MICIREEEEQEQEEGVNLLMQLNDGHLLQSPQDPSLQALLPMT